ncbi:MAG: hypothetical protein MJZ32_12770 [Bacteroidaceae bacterium]|nr:hypothetical protein [Bacteroidaceae bacterium]
MHPEDRHYTASQYLKGKVADYTISDNVIETVCFERGVDPNGEASASEMDVLQLCYADLLKYIYLQPSTTKSYAIANGTWSQKEGHTIISEEDRKRLLAEMRRIYAKYGESLVIPSEKPTIRVVAHGMRLYNRNRRYES